MLSMLFREISEITKKKNLNILNPTNWVSPEYITSVQRNIKFRMAKFDYTT